MIGPLGGRLPGDGLPDDRQRGQRGQAGQHVPADDLGRIESCTAPAAASRS